MPCFIAQTCKTRKGKASRCINGGIQARRCVGGIRKRGGLLEDEGEAGDGLVFVVVDRFGVEAFPVGLQIAAEVHTQ